MWQPDFPEDLAVVIRRLAAENGLRVGFDTHYDAGNCEVRWWTGKTLNRLDFQPLGDGLLVVTLNRDKFRVFPRLLRWAYGSIPMFPYLAKVSTFRLGELREGGPPEVCKMKLQEALALAT